MNKNDVVKEISKRKYYKKIFGKNIQKEALKHALDIRKFEIDLYWRRATYFWSLIVASFAGYFALQNVEISKRDPSSIFIISCIGLLLSLGWYLVNKGSKYWQENWERHLDALEDEIIGPLHRTVIPSKKMGWLYPHYGYPFSVSRVNQVISFIITIVWLFLALDSFPYFKKYITTETKYYLFAIFTAISSFSIIYLSWPSKSKIKSTLFYCTRFKKD